MNLLVICNITTPSVNILELLYDVQGKDIYHGYDTKVLVALMCQELAKETHPDIFREILVFLISVIYASDEKDIELKEAKKKTVKQSPVSTVKLMEDYDRILKNLKTPFADIK